MRDCVGKPKACDDTNTLDFELIALGPFVTKGPRRGLELLPYEAIPSASTAYANNQALDVERTGMDADYVRNYRRKDFLGFPLAGTYELTLDASPYHDLRKVQSVEIVIEPIFMKPTTVTR
jgi:hypothetical protein